MSTSVEKLVRAMSGSHHAHGCATCGLRFTDACKTPLENGSCNACRGGHERTLWDSNSDPRDCCQVSSKAATDTDIVAYKLAGPGPWFRCMKCARTHPYDPKGWKA